jgi:succinyl-CoA synthetase beta subunit
MNIHEYQARQLLRDYGVPVKPDFTVTAASEVEQKLGALQGPPWIVKAQAHTGGRGKAGGVKLAKSKSEAMQHTAAMLGMTLVTPQTGPKGKLVRAVMLAEDTDIAKEYYLGLLADRASADYVYIGSTEGGVEIEKVAAEAPEKILKVHVDPIAGYRPYHGAEMARKLGFTGAPAKQLSAVMAGMFRLFTEKDASLVEINPLVRAADGSLWALDAKVTFDDNGLARHPEIAALRDVHEEDPDEARAARHDLNYIKLDGTIGCLVNGAGLAMATMDIVKHHGGSPANFLDVGGTASTDKVTEAFKIILSDPNVRGILVNIFGGIMKCDVIAEGIVAASRTLGVTVPVVARLDGTNVGPARRILADSGLTIIPASSMAEAAQLIVRETQQQ